MSLIRDFIKRSLIFSFISFLIFLSCTQNLYSEEIDWIQVANTNNEMQFIDPSSIKYNNKGLLSVVTKYNEIDPEDQSHIKTNSFLMAIDCEKRLFSQLSINGDLNKVKNWIKPTNDKLIKQTIVNSCSY